MTSRPAVLALAMLLSLAPSVAFSVTKASKPSSKGHAMAVPFVDDDYARVVSQAKANKLPIFVEAWAPW